MDYETAQHLGPAHGLSRASSEAPADYAGRMAGYAVEGGVSAGHEQLSALAVQNAQAGGDKSGK